MRRSASSLITEAIACVMREAPDAHAQMRTALGQRQVELVIDNEVFRVEFDRAETSPAVTVTTSIDTLCDALTGEIDVLDAILALHLEIVGEPGALVAASEAMRWFLQGAMRCVSIQPLADEFFALRTKEL